MREVLGEGGAAPLWAAYGEVQQSVTEGASTKAGKSRADGLFSTVPTT